MRSGVRCGPQTFLKKTVLPSSLSRRLPGGSLRQTTALQRVWPRRRTQRSERGLQCFAMVNVELASPSLVLGLGLIGSGVLLFSIRKSKPSVSRDSDVIISSLITVTGGALVFQGWRLDPLLLLCQLMTCTVALWFALEAINLREQIQQKGEPAKPPVSVPRDAEEVAQEEEPWYRQGFGLPQMSATQFALWRGAQENEGYQGSAFQQDTGPDVDTSGAGFDTSGRDWFGGQDPNRSLQEGSGVYENFSAGAIPGSSAPVTDGSEDDPLDVVEDWE